MNQSALNPSSPKRRRLSHAVWLLNPDVGYRHACAAEGVDPNSTRQAAKWRKYRGKARTHICRASNDVCVRHYAAERRLNRYVNLRAA